MNDREKTNEQLVTEMAELRRRVTSLEALQAGHRRTEKVLKATDRRFRSLIEQTTDAVFCYEYEPPIPTHLPIEEQVALFYGGVLAECNDVAARSYGAVQAKEVVGRKLTDLFGTSPGSLDGFFTAFIESNYRTINAESTEMLSDDTQRYYLNNGYGVVEEGMLVRVWGTFRDITERRRIEQALEESEKSYRLLVENAAEGVFVIQDHVVRFANPRGLEILGRPEHDVVGREALDFVHPEDRQRLHGIHTSRIGGVLTPREYEYRILDQAGTIKWLCANTVTTEWADRPAALMLVTDITARKQAEEKLQGREATLQALLNAPTESAMLVDLEGTILAISEVAAQRLGKSADELVGLGIYDYLPPDLAHARRAQGEEIARTGKPVRFQDERAGNHFDNSIYPVFVAGKVAAIAVYARDITQTKQAEDGQRTALAAKEEALAEALQATHALRESEERYRSLFDGVPVGLHRTTPDGQILDANLALATMLGCRDREDLLAANAVDFYVDPENRRRWQDQIEREGIVRNFEMRLRRRDGTVIWMQMNTNAVRGSDDHALYYEGSLADITDRKRAEEIQRLYADRLRILREIDQSILIAESSNAIAKAAVAHIRRLLPCQRVGVMLFDLSRNEMEMLAVDSAVETQVQEGIRAPLDQFTNEIGDLQQDRVVIIEDFQPRGRITEAMYAEGVHSLVAVPLTYQAQLVGFLNLGLSSPGALTFEHLDIARQVADQLAIAIQQARLHEQAQHHAEELKQRVDDRTQELSVLYEVAALASQSLDLETMLARSLAHVLEAVACDAGTIHLLDEGNGTPGTETLELAVQQNIPAEIVASIRSLPASKGLGKWLVEHVEPLIVPDIASDPRMPVALPIEPHAYVGVPLRASGRTLGVLGIVRSTEKPHLSVEEISLLSSIADQLGGAVESNRLRQRAEQAAVLEERERLARDLHDSVTQLLYSVNLFAKSGRNAYNLGDMDELDYCLAELGEIGQQALREMRLLVYELRPHMLQQEGLIGALQHRLDSVEGRAGVATQLLASEGIQLPGWIERELYHIATEALNNCLKYANASSVTIQVEADQERIQLEIADDGAGFDARDLEARGGLGMISMRERATRIGGVLEVTSASGEGTSVKVVVSSRQLIPAGSRR